MQLQFARPIAHHFHGECQSLAGEIVRAPQKPGLTVCGSGSASCLSGAMRIESGADEIGTALNATSSELSPDQKSGFSARGIADTEASMRRLFSAQMVSRNGFGSEGW
jgi:hypothetical protein